MTKLEKLLVLLGNPCECNEETAEVCLSMAEDAVLDYIGRDQLPKGAENIVIKLAVIYYNRLGNEGETSRSEGGISQSFSTDIPMDIQRQLWNYPRKVGVIHSETVEE
jgi:hypothetical protein